MNSLIGMGALTSFVAGLASPMAPGVAFDTSFLEEPVMLLAFVLLGPLPGSTRPPQSLRYLALVCWAWQR